MLTTLVNRWKLAYARQQLKTALRYEEMARNRMVIERQRMAELEKQVEWLEIVVFTAAFYEEAGW